MYFDSLIELIAMDGHGAYVWSVYGLAAVVLTYLFITPLYRQRLFAIQIKGQMRREKSVQNQTRQDQE